MQSGERKFICDLDDQSSGISRLRRRHNREPWFNE